MTTWQILICTLEVRCEQFKRLLNTLKAQIVDAGLLGQVEVLFESDCFELSTGAKRNLLVERATADYTCFVDDDDHVTDNYVRLLYEAMTKHNSVDCVGISGLMRQTNWPPGHERAWRFFEHSIRFSESGGDLLRTHKHISHLCPIRREIALRFPFPDQDRGEDWDYTERLVATHVLRKEAFVSQPVYIYIPARIQDRWAADESWREAVVAHCVATQPAVPSL